MTNQYGRGLGFLADGTDSPPGGAGGYPGARSHRAGGAAHRPGAAARLPVSFVKGETVTNKLPELLPKTPPAAASVTPATSTGSGRTAEPGGTGKATSARPERDRTSPAVEQPPLIGPSLPSEKSAKGACHGQAKVTHDAIVSVNSK